VGNIQRHDFLSSPYDHSTNDALEPGFEKTRLWGGCAANRPSDGLKTVLLRQHFRPQAHEAL